MVEERCDSTPYVVERERDSRILQDDVILFSLRLGVRPDRTAGLGQPKYDENTGQV